MSETLISFENVGKTFHAERKTVEAVRGVSLDVRAGELVTIVGPSGCGKSTLLNMTAGLFQPTTGAVRYRGTAVTGINLRTGYMTQSDHLLPWRTVAANIEVPLEIQGAPRAAMRRKVESSRIGRSSRLREVLSVATLRRHAQTHCACAALAYDPETLLLDEPFAALDAQLRLNMQIELLRLTRKFNKTVLFVTHDLDEAAALGDRCVVFSARPGTITHVIESTLPRERD